MRDDILASFTLGLEPEDFAGAEQGRMPAKRQSAKNGTLSACRFDKFHQLFRLAAVSVCARRADGESGAAEFSRGIFRIHRVAART